MEDNAMTRADYPPYLPDLVPPDVCLCANIKSGLSEISFDDGGNFLSAVVAILAPIEKSTLDRVFLASTDTAQRGTDISGDSVE
jgi:hypothetical protein